jgi:hypothetical protein
MSSSGDASMSLQQERIGMLCSGLKLEGMAAMAFAYRAVMAAIKTRFITAADLMLQLAAAKAQGRLREYFNRALLTIQCPR